MLRALPFVVAALLLVGCSKRHEQETSRVRGLVTLDGKPLPSGGVMFVPPSGRGATGMIQSDGTYVLGTYGDDDGAIVGEHSVSVVPQVGPADADSEAEVALPASSMLRRPYRGIKVVVESGKDNVIDIPLSSDK